MHWKKTRNGQRELDFSVFQKSCKYSSAEKWQITDNWDLSNSKESIYNFYIAGNTEDEELHKLLTRLVLFREFVLGIDHIILKYRFKLTLTSGKIFSC